MALRLQKRAIRMLLREKKLFMVFMLIYTALIFLTSFFIFLMVGGTFGELATFFVGITILTSLILSMMYAMIIVSRNRRTWATLKCIGYTNKDIRKLISGNILFTTLMGLFIVIEVLFHYSAIVGYSQTAGLLLDLPVVLIGLVEVIVTSCLFILVQFVAIWIAYRKSLKVRPILALKKVGE